MTFGRHSQRWAQSSASTQKLHFPPRYTCIAQWRRLLKPGERRLIGSLRHCLSGSVTSTVNLAFRNLLSGLSAACIRLRRGIDDRCSVPRLRRRVRNSRARNDSVRALNLITPTVQSWYFGPSDGTFLVVSYGIWRHTLARTCCPVSAQICAEWGECVRCVSRRWVSAAVNGSSRRGGRFAAAPTIAAALWGFFVFGKMPIGYSRAELRIEAI